MDAKDPPQPERQPELPRDVIQPKVIQTKDLFGTEREICLEHDGERYRLRITRRGKLILQK